ncbi:hypothetical protein Dimus_034625 [Dionaea muscipula]
MAYSFFLSGSKPSTTLCILSNSFGIQYPLIKLLRCGSSSSILYIYTLIGPTARLSSSQLPPSRALHMAVHVWGKESKREARAAEKHAFGAWESNSSKHLKTNQFQRA